MDSVQRYLFWCGLGITVLIFLIAAVFMFGLNIDRIFLWGSVILATTLFGWLLFDIWKDWRDDRTDQETCRAHNAHDQAVFGDQTEVHDDA